MYDDDLIDDYDDYNVISNANELLGWCADAGWSDEQIVEVCKLLLETTAGIESAKDFAKTGGLLN